MIVGTNPSPEGATFKVSCCANSCKAVPDTEFMQLSTAAQLIPASSEHWKMIMIRTQLCKCKKYVNYIRRRYPVVFKQWQSDKTVYVLCNGKPHFDPTRPSSGRNEKCSILFWHI